MFEWGKAVQTLRALNEDLQLDSDEEAVIAEEEMAGAFSSSELLALSEMLGCEVDQLIEADEETLQEMMGYMMGRMEASQMMYGNPGLSGRKPWEMNEPGVGAATAGAELVPEGLPDGSRSEMPSMRAMAILQGLK